MQQPLPPISILIPTYNEQDFIIECVDSLIGGRYSQELLEILVIDGGSTDRTRSYVESMPKGKATIRFLSNPKKIVPAAMNIGIEQASNEILVWVGAHAIYDEDYLLNLIQIFLQEDCASVGGVIQPTAKTMTGKIIATATSSKFGIGNAKYRYSTSRQTVDTVFGGCWKKTDILSIGGFNENWVRNQDYELNYRLRTKVGPLILDPSIKCHYFCRETIAGLAKQYYNYGYWRLHTVMKHPKSFSTRQAAPLLLLTGLLASLITIPFNIHIALLIPSMYLFLLLSFSAKLSIENRSARYFFLLPIAFATLHLSWAIGFAKGALNNMHSQTHSNNNK